jgi:hypothetical protein
MRFAVKTILGWAIVPAFLCTLVFAQEPAEPGSPSEAIPADSDQERTPNSNVVAQNAFGEPLTGRLRLSGNLDYDYQYDDNVFANSLFPLSDSISNFAARFSLATQQKRLGFELHYAPSYRLHYSYDDRNAFAQNLANRIEYRLSRHTTLGWYGTLADTSTNSSSPFTFVDVGGTLVPVFSPTALQTDARVLSSSGNLNLQHQFSARSSFRIGVSGATSNFFEQNGNPLPSARSSEQYSVTGNIGWDYEFSRGKSFGVEASQRYAGFLSPAAHVNYQFAKLRYQQRFKNGYALKLGAGPSFTQSSIGSGGSDDATGFAVDGSVTKLARSYRAALQYSRGTNIGSVQGATVSDQFSAVVDRSFLRRWNAGGSVSYSRSKALAVSNDLDSLGLSVNARYAVTRTVALRTQYQHQRQFGDEAGFFGSSFERNVFSVGVAYQFGMDPGR